MNIYNTKANDLVSAGMDLILIVKKFVESEEASIENMDSIQFGICTRKRIHDSYSRKLKIPRGVETSRENLPDWSAIPDSSLKSDILQ